MERRIQGVRLKLNKEGEGFMATGSKPLELSDTYRHFNSLIWQVPSWGVAIATAVIVAADQLGKDANTWTIPVKYVQASVLAFGAFLLTALAIALYRYRAYQAASAPEPSPTPPFRQQPKANLYLQGSLCLISGAVAGLAVAQALSQIWLILSGLIAGIIGWIFAERGNEAVVKKINNLRK
jgi:hypothetical protein